ncbi:Hypothetical protein KVN_LOCUS75, partial [uncultured virus]
VTVNCQLFDQQNQIIIGPNNYFIGINLNITLYPENTSFNIDNEFDSIMTHIIMQRAIDQIGLNGGGTLHILPSTYTIQKNLVINWNGIHLKGSGIDQTIIKLEDFSSALFQNITKSGLIRAQNISNMIMSDLTLNGNRQNQYYNIKYLYARYGIYTEACTNLWFDQIKIMNFQDYGFNPKGSKSNSNWANYLTITNSISTNNGWDGFAIDQTNNVIISDCIAENNGRHGFNIMSGSKTVILMNNIANNNGFADKTFNNANGCGFTIQNNFLLGTGDVILDGNNAKDNLKTGICLSDVYNIKIINNNIEGTCTCLVSNNKTCTCLNFINEYSVIVKNNTCSTYKFSNSLNFYNISDIEDYINDNIFNKIPYCDDQKSFNLSIFSYINYLLILFLSLIFLL